MGCVLYFRSPMNPNFFLAAKSLHIIFVVAWFAGLFYFPRLLIYQEEARRAPEAARAILIQRFQLMSRRLWYIITWPAGVLSTLFALWMLHINPNYLQQPWMHLKLLLVLLLFAYHGILHWLFLQQQKERYPMSTGRLRLFNEVATLLLFAIVFTVVYKDTSAWYYGLAGLLLLAALLMLGVKLYAARRRSKGERT